MRTYVYALVMVAALLFGRAPLCKAQVNELRADGISSLRVVVGDNWLSMPVMALNGSDAVNIDFDDLTHEYRRYVYSIRHCDADWAESDGLFASDYCEGFIDGNMIDDVQQSVNTTVPYTHYHFQIPNDKCRPTASGNYRVTVYDDNTKDTVLRACFMICEPIVGVGLGVTTNTDVDINQRYQQVEMKINYAGIPVNDYRSEIKTVVMQNGFWHTAVRDAQPQYVSNDGLRWEHCRQFIFEAGNEYRKFETLDPSHTTMGLESVGWDGERYHAYIWPDEPRPNYVHDEDANGAFYIRNSDNVENETASDYVVTHFTLLSPRLPNDVYVIAKWTDESTDRRFLMQYDEDRKCYAAAIDLKQGYYSYRYVLARADGRLVQLPSEGNFFQTENEYEALVYYRARGARTDRLVGYGTVRIK